MLDERRSVTSKKNAAQVDLAAWSMASYSLAWPDVEFTSLFQKGVKPIGEQQHFGVFRKREAKTAASIEQMLKEHNVSKASFSKVRPPRADQTRVIWDATKEKQRLGFLSDFKSAQQLDEEFGTDEWMSLPRFAIWQSSKYRMIDNGAKLHNPTFASGETIHTTSSGASVVLVKLFRKYCGKLQRRWKLLVWSRDLWKAYQQLPVADDFVRYCVIRVYDPDAACWRLTVSTVCLFGFTAAVIHFNRVPTLAVAWARRWLAIPVQHFFDDHRLVEPMICKGDAFLMFKSLEDLFGLRFDPSKDQGPTKLLVFL